MEIKFEEKLVYKKPEALSDGATHYCPGCTHGLIHKLIGEVIDELDIRERTISVSPVGCAVFLYKYFELDGAEAAHGRAPAMATGLKRVQPDKLVFTYQGDGDMASIGLSEIMWAATRGENITVFFVNNAIYGMTGGQMAPTSLPGQVTGSSPRGRDVETSGMPLQMSELLATLPGATYVVRRSVHSIQTIKQAKKAIRTAFKVQMADAGFSMVEFLSSCPTNWGISPHQSLEWIKDNMVPYFPLGDYKVDPVVKSLN
ncbi:MAG TPA: 2-oxoglutarate oxidoreductase [Chloroflexi bacterium]|nr:2-oxoglutarate oxidoreductase [Chloroflexota bacterium]